MLSKKCLVNYMDTLKEVEELGVKIKRLEKEIQSAEDELARIEENETVKDKVYGGEGGWQGFVIEGIPVPEYSTKSEKLRLKKALLGQRKSTLELIQLDLVRQVKDVEMFVASLDDAYIRRIINFRFVQRMSWTAVAMKIGGDNTADSVRMAFTRFMEKS